MKYIFKQSKRNDMKTLTQLKEEIEATKKQIISDSENIDRCISVINSNVEKTRNMLNRKRKLYDYIVIRSIDKEAAKYSASPSTAIYNNNNWQL